uniref:VWFA domain-containing protein n=1 Tax=Panagrellus redivivus TaxID=6233 RepID=A0A7E4VIB2_PANRE
MAQADVARWIILLIVTGVLAGDVDLHKRNSHSSESHENGHNGGPSGHGVTVGPKPDQNGKPWPGDPTYLPKCVKSNGKKPDCQIDLTIALDYSFAAGRVQNADEIANYTVTQILPNLPIHRTQVRVAITIIGTNQPFYSPYLSHREDICDFIRRTLISRHTWGNRIGHLTEPYTKFIAVNALPFARPVRRVFLILTAINNPLDISAAIPTSLIVRQKAHVAIVGINQGLGHRLDRIADKVVYTQFGKLNGSVNKFIFDNTCQGSGIHPSVASPTTEFPTVGPPTSVKPSTESATSKVPTVGPTDGPSTSVEPSTESPTVEPTSVAASTESPTTEVPTVEPTSESPTTEVPTVGPTDGPSTSVEPSTESPTTEVPTVEPTSESPTTEVPTTVEPTSESPTTEVPTVGPTDGPSTSVEPSTESPTTEVPTVEPTSESPTTEVPTVGPTDGPSTSVEPSTESPTTEVPTVEPTSESPTTEVPTVEPTSESPTTEVPTVGPT